MTVHKGECFCGAVRVEVTGEPEAMGYCHCSSCRSWSASPVNAFTLWKPEAVKVPAGAEHLATFQKTPRSERQYCAKCGGHLMTNHPYLGLVDIYAATLPTLKFSPAVHVNYAETVLPMRDGLPKFKDFPAEFGGSGETIPD
ncbi:MAG: GFA family protein [Methyloceanibacter sp.]|nr:GFA family protein [Methyloceanibacter sp.]